MGVLDVQAGRLGVREQALDTLSFAIEVEGA